MIDFTGFTSRDFRAFADNKCRKRAYNEERKAVWIKMQGLKTELDGLMPARIRGKVSTFWPNQYNVYSVWGIWIGYSHEKPLSRYPHLEVSIDDSSVWVFLMIPINAKKFQRRFKNYILENGAEVLDELANLPKIRGTEFAINFARNDGISVNSPDKISDKALQSYARKIDPGANYLWIGYSFNRSDSRLKTRRFIGLAGKLMVSLYPLYKHAFDGPDESIITDLAVEGSRVEKVLKRLRRSKIKEGKEHKLLKKYLADHPETLERGLKFECEEYPFITGDRVDLLFSDAFGKLVVIEVEPKVEKDQLVGLLQAVKYKYMLAVRVKKNFHYVRAFLVAKIIHSSVKRLAKRYGVTTKEIK